MTLLIEQRGAARWVRLNRPERRNALTPALIAALNQALAEAMSDEHTAVVVIAGEGPGFCAGADLKHLFELASTGGDPIEFLAAISRCFTDIERAPKPVVAAVHGHVVAGGLELALACDVVVAKSGTLMGDGHVRNGLLPGGGASVRLPRKVGESLARWLMLSGELLPAEAFVPSGFVRAVAAEGEFVQAVDLAVERLCVAKGNVHGRIKALLRDSHRSTLQAALDRELAVFGEHWHESDIAGALGQFLNRTLRR